MFDFASVKCNFTLCNTYMIVSIKHKGLKLLFEKGDGSKIRPDHLRKVQNILTRLHAAKQINDMNAPALRLHQLSGSMRGKWSVTVNGNWRIIFEFENGDAYLVDYLDYH